MIDSLKLVHRTARLRTLALLAAGITIAGCDNADRLGPAALGENTPILASDSASITGDDATFVDGDTLTDAQLDANEALPEAEFASGALAKRGIAFGAYNLPSSAYSSTYTGSVIAVGPGDIISRLQAARRSGARVLVRLSAGDRYWLNKNHTVNLNKWKAQIARFKRANLQPFIKDGTLLGHVLIDEPHDKSNWGGRPVPFATLEAMAKYSKQVLPGLTTVVRSYADWLAQAKFRWKYLDATMAQYSARKGEVKRWMRGQATAARKEGLGLIVSLNVLNGGNKASRLRGLYRGNYAMSASQLRQWGSVLASNSSSCGLFFWNYNRSYISRSDIRSALGYLSSRAKSRSRQSCRI
jgi:hypothetical protein